ncbi:MAG TPA: glycerophosphodiester phosphodiesterase family protein [Lysobacter sp.]
MIAPRGASGYRPEHTLEAYRLAIRQGADYIEPDLVATSDGVLVARHDNEISTTTDVAAHPAFARRRTTKTVDGMPVTGWFTEDFTLAELRTLRARERLSALRPANTRFDGMYAIPTFAEILQLARRESRDGRVIGVYPETKHPTYFAREGCRLEGGAIAVSLGALLVDTLVAEGITDPGRVFIQSFEIENLLELKRWLMPAAGIDLPLVQLLGDLAADAPYDIVHNVGRGADLGRIYPGLQACVDSGLGAHTRYAALAAGEVLRWMRANYAEGIGPSKDDLLQATGHQDRTVGHDKGRQAPRDAAGAAHPMLADALDAGLLVHPYTLRAESCFLTPSIGGDMSVINEAVQLFELGVQGIFIDQPDLGVVARDLFLHRNPAVWD